MTDDTASLDSPLLRRVIGLEEEAARLLREAEVSAATLTADTEREIETMRTAAQAGRAERVGDLEREARDLLERDAADAETRHAAAMAAVDEDCPERREAAIDYLLTRLKNASP